MADAIACAKAGQSSAYGYYNLERMANAVAKKASVKLGGTCIDARGPDDDDDFVDVAKHSTMPKFARSTADADKVPVF